MASTGTPIPLRGKLNQVEHILDDASKELQQEVLKYEIFTTKASASASEQYQQCANNSNQVPNDLFKTICDISTLKSVLSCPIFNRIVNVKDTLDNLSYQVNLHPSIGPSDIKVDDNGELILAPPIETPCHHSLLNGRLEAECLGSVQNLSQTESNQTPLNVKCKTDARRYDQSRSNIRCSPEMQPNDNFASTRNHAPQPLQESCIQNSQICQSKGIPTQTSLNNYNVEKLVSNGGLKVTSNGGRHDLKGNLVESNGIHSRRLYRANGQQGSQMTNSPLQELDNNNKQMSSDSSSPHIQTLDDSIYNNGYSNELYKTAHELTTETQHLAIAPRQNESTNFYNNGKSCSTNSKVYTQAQGNKSQQVSIDQNYVRSSCSPSTSVGSTIRLADECDSGASSYQSHNAKVTSFNEHITGTSKLNERTRPVLDQPEQEQVDESTSDMQRIQVTLEKDHQGLGLTVAGYTCDMGEISGIFVKYITKNGPASGKIQPLDQICAVNGRDILGISNTEAMSVLKNSGKIVTLELSRYLAGPKFEKLQKALASATPSSNVARAAMSPATINQRELVENSTPVVGYRTKVSTVGNKPVALQDNSAKSLNCNNPVDPLSVSDLPVEGLYKNDYISINTQSTTVESRNESKERLINSQIPIAAQRNGANKVIATKQGARNTIEIKSPFYASAGSSNLPNTDVLKEDQSLRAHPDSYFKSSTDEVSSQIPVIEETPEWERNVECVELYKDVSQGLGFAVKEYRDPRDPKQSIIMIISITPGGTAERDGRLSCGDLLIFVDDTDLKNAGFSETVKALKRTNGQVRLGVLKLKRHT